MFPTFVRARGACVCFSVSELIRKTFVHTIHKHSLNSERCPLVSLLAIDQKDITSEVNRMHSLCIMFVCACASVYMSSTRCTTEENGCRKRALAAKAGHPTNFRYRVRGHTA